MLSLLLCLLVAPGLALPLPPWKPGQEPRELALQDEVSILLHGVLQFSQALSSIYKNTDMQMEEVGRSLSLYQQTLALLEQDTQQVKEQKQRLQQTLEGIQEDEEELQLQSVGIVASIREMLEGQQALQSRVKQLEEALGRPGTGRPREDLEALKERADEQSRIVWSLMGVVQLQQQQMAQQRQRLSRIHGRLQTSGLPS
ncbi:angiopoietin-like protein 8 [Tachyglossus aculeatus]|uniref:angiopoietin-like protein 8 n=1 Tax=Tachyglossus aculeatus TaxID=9261 RepID=UPI0018F755C4|nr:angiopoietin-like protein 8 [Tachyglossus aculeatus]